MQSGVLPAQQKGDVEKQEPSAHSQQQIQLWSAHTDAASVSVLSARGRPSRGAGEKRVRTSVRVRITMLSQVRVCHVNMFAVTSSIMTLIAAQKRVDEEQLDKAQ